MTEPPLNALRPPQGSRCQETSMFLPPLPCSAPAEYVVRNSDPEPYYMCAGCADHNVRNRGARYVTPEYR